MKPIVGYVLDGISRIVDCLMGDTEAEVYERARLELMPMGG